jgi:hypothetical protein
MMQMDKALSHKIGGAGFGENSFKLSDGLQFQSSLNF